jgi:hypothetical protein
MTLEEKKAILGAYHFLLSFINDHPKVNIEISEEQQLHSIREAARDFDTHNRKIGFNVTSVDIIKCISFVGCHLLSWLPTTGEQDSVIHSLVKCLDSVAAWYRDDEGGLPSDHMLHIERLLRVEAYKICEKPFVELGDIWGHGYWRVGLYMSFLSAAKGGTVG